MARIEIMCDPGGDTINELTVHKWFKKVGDRVEKGEIILHYESEKVDFDLDAPESGVLAEIIPGDDGIYYRPENKKTGSWKALVGYIETSDAVEAEKPVTPAKEKIKVPEAAQTPAPEKTQEPETKPVVIEKPVEKPSAKETPTPKSEMVRTESDFPKAGPMVRKRAREEDIDLLQVTPTGPHGTVTLEDLKDYLEKKVVVAPPVHEKESTPKPEEKKSTQKPEPKKNPLPDTEEFKIVPLTRIQAIIAKNMKLSDECIPDRMTSVRIDMRHILRAKLLAPFNGLHDAMGTENASAYLRLETVVIEGIIRALEGKCRYLNSCFGCEHFDFEGRKQFLNINLGIAYDEKGLIVPSLSRMQGTTYKTIAERTTGLYKRLRNNQASPAEMIGENRTFTFNNVGPLGMDDGLSMIPHGTSAICVMHRVETDGTKDLYGFANVSLVFDHRLHNGREAAQFLNEVKTFVEKINFKEHVIRQFDKFP